MKTIHITSQEELRDVAEAIVRDLGRRTVVAFRGEMGAGKTTLIREIAAVLGATDTVTSPTFAIVNQYKGANNRRIYTSTSTASTTSAKPTTSATRSTSTRETSVWWSGPRRSSSCSRKTS